jgi:ABC-type nitrate/sulfonate/bicarbonate transport system ATPase subunit
VLFDSALAIDLSPQQRRVAVVFQDYALFPHLTVRQNIAFARRTGWLNPARDASDAAVERWITAFHLEAVSGHYPHQLSGGQRQRTALARALVNDPAALLLDEPFAALDAQTREHMQGELTRIWAARRTTSILVTHSISEAVFLADRVVVFGPRPARVREIVPIDLPRPRRLAVKHSPRFRELEQTVWNLIESEREQR